MIGPSDGLCDAVQQVLTALGYADVVVVERYSSHGRHVSLTFQLRVDSGEHLDRIYCELERIDGVSYLF